MGIPLQDNTERLLLHPLLQSTIRFKCLNYFSNKTIYNEFPDFLCLCIYWFHYITHYSYVYILHLQCIIHSFVCTFCLSSRCYYDPFVYILGPTLSLCVLQDLVIKPTLCELLAFVYQLKQSKILLWIYVACQYVLWHAHL